MNLKKSISVVIPTFNGVNLLRQYLPTVITALEYSNLEYEIIIIDDASSDDSETFIKSNFGLITFLKNEKNSGFAATINRGIQIAKKDLVLCLNNDMELPENYFDTLLLPFEDEQTFGVMSLIMDSTKTKVLEARKIPIMTLLGIVIEDDFSQSDKEKIETLFVCGGNGLYDRKKLQFLNGFSELYAPFYHEDVDLSIRAWMLGWKSYVVNSAHCYHQHSATIKANFSSSYISSISYRNRLVFSWKYANNINRIKIVRNAKQKALKYGVTLTSATRFNRLKAILSFLKRRKAIVKEHQLFTNKAIEHGYSIISFDEVYEQYFKS